MKIMQFGGCYFLIVVFLHFTVNQLRQLSIFPQIGRRAAGLIEALIMFVVIIIVATILVRSIGSRLSPKTLLVSGAFALVLMMFCGLVFDIGIGGYRPGAYFESSDKTTRVVYGAGLVFFVTAPALVQQVRMNSHAS